MNILLKNLIIAMSIVAGLQAMENPFPKEIESKILKEVVIETVKDTYVNQGLRKYTESICPLIIVCTRWQGIIDKEWDARTRLNIVRTAMVLGCEQICPGFLNGKLIYRPDANSDVGKIVLKTSDFWDPLKGTFDLYECGDTGKHLSIMTGYRKGKKPANAPKVEIWFTPQALIEKRISTKAAHFKPIMDNWKQEQAPVGIFWTFNSWDDPSVYDYLITENMDNLSKINLYENWQKSDKPKLRYLLCHDEASDAARCFTFCF